MFQVIKTAWALLKHIIVGLAKQSRLVGSQRITIELPMLDLSAAVMQR